MASKIRVYGRAQNRTALGIVQAYMVLYPEATLAQLREAFPKSLCPDCGVDELFVTVKEAKSRNTPAMSLYFAKSEETMNLVDGSAIAFAQLWTKTSFNKIVSHAAQYGIEVAEFSKTGRFERGGYRLEYLNGFVPENQPKKKKGFPRWLWLLLALLILIGILLVFALKPAPQPTVVEKIVEKEIIIRDTVYVKQIEEIQENFNAAQFEKNKADLNDDAKFALHDLAKVMKQNPELRLDIKGHTSAEGDAEFNRNLSEERAKAVVDFLVQKEGIEPDRLTYRGCGSSQPIDPQHPEAGINRRTEFEIIK